MRKPQPGILSFVPFFVLALLGLALAGPAAAGDETLLTQVSLLIGRPAEGAAATDDVLVVPGTVITAISGPPLRAAEVSNEEKQNRRLADLARDLRKTLRLGHVEVRYRQPLNLEMNVETDLLSPSASSDITMTIKLLGFNDSSALYEVRLFQGSAVLADTRVTARRGQRAIVGGLDGDEAPYLFLAVEPVSAGDETVAEDGVSPPRPIHKVPPQYTPTARAARVQGVVVLMTTIDENGDVVTVEPLKGLPMGLTEEAVKAVRQWKYEPATDAEGRPVEVRLNLTVTFRMPSAEE